MPQRHSEQQPIPKINTMNTTHKQLDHKLVAAAKMGATAEVAILLDRGANIHAMGDEALIGAALNGHTDTVALLLNRGADPNARDGGALRMAAKNGHTEVFWMLKAALSA